jgi:hypothetical protein
MSIADFEIGIPLDFSAAYIGQFDAASSGTRSTADDGGRNHIYIIQ